jgi:hypothetical protein
MTLRGASERIAMAKHCVFKFYEEEFYTLLTGVVS